MQKFYENFMFSDLTWKKSFAPGNGGAGVGWGVGALLPPPLLHSSDRRSYAFQHENQLKTLTQG